jgi:predicted RNA methylase
MKRSEKDEKFAHHLPGVLQYHYTMLDDGLRNELIYKALVENVSEDTSFLDIGAGTGVWAIVAAKLGAKRVVAVEIEECLIPIIYKHAVENGVADRIEIVHGNSDDVRLRGKFDVIVSELFGGDAFGRETIQSYIDVRERYLAPDGILIPQKMAMLAVPVRVEPPISSIPKGLDIKSEFFKQIRQNYGHNFSVAERQNIEFLAEPAALVEVDFRTIEEPPTLTDLTASWQMNELRRANGILSFSQSTFTDTIAMDAFHSQSWGVGVNDFTPFEIGEGELTYKVTIDQTKGNWSVGVPSKPDLKTQSYGPIFAFSRIRMAQLMTPHRRYRSPVVDLKKKKAKKTDRRPTP